MPSPSIAERINTHASNRFANTCVEVKAAPAAARIVLRGTPKGASNFTKSIGLELPVKPGQTATVDKKHALWIGPDEWFIYDEDNNIESMMPKLANKDFTCIDVSHRNMAFTVTGEAPHHAENLLNAACPRDLSLTSFPVATASRTVFGRAEIILYRLSENSFRVECWRSFAPYVWEYLLEGAKDADI